MPFCYKRYHSCYEYFYKGNARGGVEDTRPRTQKKSKAKAKNSLSEDRPFRGQGQECSRARPRTKDTGASVLKKKKKVFKIFFRPSPIQLAYPEFLIWGGLNHKSHAMTSSKFFQRGSFCGKKLS